MIPEKKDTTIQCRRCTTCCRKGGPGLHLSDQPLVEFGIIALKDLITIRRGEPSYDNIRGVVAPARTDIIKIQAVGSDNTSCIFLQPETAGCAMYEDRPLECRALKCWDTREITDCYRKDRLTRLHLLEKAHQIRDVINEHQNRCDYGRFAQWAEDLRTGRNAEKAREAMMSMMRYDISLRQVTVEHTRLDDRLLPFLFGRTINSTLSWFRIRMVRAGSRVSVDAY
jgi:Fe-S-cluster containining protein